MHTPLIIDGPYAQLPLTIDGYAAQHHSTLNEERSQAFQRAYPTLPALLEASGVTIEVESGDLSNDSTTYLVLTMPDGYTRSLKLATSGQLGEKSFSEAEAVDWVKAILDTRQEVAKLRLRKKLLLAAGGIMFLIRWGLLSTTTTEEGSWLSQLLLVGLVMPLALWVVFTIFPPPACWDTSGN